MSIHPIADLSFVADRAEPKGGQLPRNFWNVSPSGDYLADCKMGGALAREYLEYLIAVRRTGSSSSLQNIVADMPQHLTGVEIGFLEIIGLAAMQGADYGIAQLNFWDRCRSKEAA